MKLIVIISFLLINSTAFSQGFIGKTRSQVKDQWKRYLSKNPRMVEVNEYDSLLTIDIRDSAVKKVDFIYIFGQDGKCHSEIKLGCNDCIVNFFKENLKSKKYQWKEVNDSVYYSNYSSGMKMEFFKQDSLNVLRIRRSD